MLKRCQLCSIAENQKLSESTYQISITAKKLRCLIILIAFATSLGFGYRIEEIIYDSKIMCQHLLNYLKNKRIEHVPVQDGNTIQRRKRKALVIEVLCSCRQPYYPVIVLCEKCEEWFHFDCERIPKSAIEYEDIVFSSTGRK